MPRAKQPAADAALLDKWGRRNRKLADKACERCGTIFRPASSSSRYCSRPCLWVGNGGQNRKPETWWKDQKGYIEGNVFIDGAQRRIRQHRWVMEQHLQRRLRPDEVVHHINGDKSDNRIENLQLMSHGEHSRHTNLNRPYRRWSKRIRGRALAELKAQRAALAKARGERT